MTRTFLAKGKRGLVYLEEKGGKKTVIKKPNPKSTAIFRLENEANFLKKLNEYDIGPRFISLKGDELRMEYVAGERIMDYFAKSSKTKIKKIILEVFKQVRTMDELGINKKEMTNPYKHIIVRKDTPVMIDFERCTYSENLQNVTQFCQYLVRENTQRILDDKGIKIDKKKLFELAKTYKSDPTAVNFSKIRKVFT